MGDESFPAAPMRWGPICVVENGTKWRFVEVMCLSAAIRLVACYAEESYLDKSSEKRVSVGIAQVT